MRNCETKETRYKVMLENVEKLRKKKAFYIVIFDIITGRDPFCDL